MKYFEFNSKKIFIYGAGSVGLKMIRQKKLRVEAFVDRRGQDIKTFNGYRVLSIEELCNIQEKDSCCIVIAIRDVFSHSEIAEKFFHAGFRNLIFKPYSVLNGTASGDSDLINISAAYDSLTVPELSIVHEVPCYNGEILFEFMDSAIIEGDSTLKDGMIKFHAPAELLFSNDLCDDENLWTKRNFCCNYIAVDLYRTLETEQNDKQESFEKYISQYALPGAKRSCVNVSGEWKNMVVEARLSAFYEMKKRLSTDANFFTKHCTTVSFSSPFRLQLIKSGKSRCSFFVALRLPYIPVEISVKDYECFLNVSAAKKVYEYLSEQKIARVSVPIPHPCFYAVKNFLSEYVYLWESKIARCLMDISFKLFGKFDDHCIHIEDYSKDDGALSRYLYNCGFSVRRREKESYLTKLLDNLFCMPDLPTSSHDVKLEGLTFMQIGKIDEQIAEKVQENTDFVFVLQERNSNASLKTVLENNFISEQLSSTVVDGKEITGLYFLRRN